MTWNEPIPDFETRIPGRLESCLAAPFQTFSRKDLYPGLTAKAAALFYFIIKNHPFENGNKRLAVTALLCLLHLNGRWLKIVDHTQLYELAVRVAESDPYYKDELVAYAKKFIERHLVRL
jgi:death-on-curing protein